ncbi:MAG: hypothetical protein O3C45_00535 [Bacteroidetes bacterium]|nr:hypothetical protein [Verrucomicrobiota bacterium]MDA0873527.1 hypothetical protein [Bacteroidota bacterium]
MSRTYSEKEIAALLQRTAQLQAQEAESKDGAREGLSLSELETVARDAGLDPQLLHQAALEMAHSGGRTLGKNRTRTHVRVDRVLSAELSEAEWEDVIFALRRRFESDSLDMGGAGSLGKGKIEQIGRSREWRHTSFSGVQTSVLFRPKEGGTHMDISQRVGLSSTKVESWAYGTPFALFFAVITGAVAKSLLIGAAATVGWLAFLVPFVYYLDNRWREKKHDQLVEMADELQEIVMRDERASLLSNNAVKDGAPVLPTTVLIDIPEEEASAASSPSGRIRSR